MKTTVVADFVSSRWNGGTTVQLCICPAQAQYQDRDFLWRLSTASVECERSEFTHLPDYNRIIALLGGELSLDIDGHREKLERCVPFAFDGAAPVVGLGRAVDFNLMLRKDHCQGRMFALSEQTLYFGPQKNWSAATHLIYAADPLAVQWKGGGAALPAGGLLRLDGSEDFPVEVKPKGCAMAASIWYNK